MGAGAVSAERWLPVAPGTGAANHNARAVERVAADGSAQRFESIADAVAIGFRAACIVEVCRGTQKSHGGYAWRYAEGSVR